MIAAAVAILFSAGLIFWQVKARKAEAVNLSAEDMAIIAEDQSPQMRARLATDETFRKEFAKDVQRVLAVAEEAENHGVQSSPEIVMVVAIRRRPTNSEATGMANAELVEFVGGAIG